MKANFVFEMNFPPDVARAWAENGLGEPAITVEVANEAEAKAMLADFQAEAKANLRLVMGDLPKPERVANPPTLIFKGDGTMEVGPRLPAHQPDPATVAWAQEVLAKHRI